jgi:hypothetical protein
MRGKVSVENFVTVGTGTREGSTAGEGDDNGLAVGVLQATMNMGNAHDITSNRQLSLETIFYYRVTVMDFTK